MLIRFFTTIIFFLILSSCSTAIPDWKLQDDVASRLNNSSGMRSVAVIVKDGVATLTGTVSNVSDKSVAESLAKIDGVKEVRNNILIVIPTPEPTPDSYVGSSETETESPSYETEALDEARKFSDKVVVQCGNSYYFGSNLRSLYECKDPVQIEIKGKSLEPLALSQADRLNGVDPYPVEWDGSATFTLKTCRRNLSRNSWTQWYDYGEHFELHLKKAKGVWKREQPNEKAQAPYFMVSVSCSDIKKLTTNSGTTNSSSTDSRKTDVNAASSSNLPANTKKVSNSNR